MKTLEQLRLVTEEDLPEIYCDMDEVLVDLLKGAEAVLGMPFVDADRIERWNKIHAVKNFWENLDWMPGAERLYQFIIRYDAHILSAYSSQDSNSITGKRKWLRKNAPKFRTSRIHIVKREQKKNFAVTDGKPNVLIDDHLKNIQEWESAGGIGIHHKNLSKTINELRRIGFK
tara:strand:+ start:415 stop:933 length:519 start_codon:yes stop_codon:yes gene_type:complete